MTHSEILTACSGLKILIVGDVILDHYIWGDVQRISPEAPVPVVHATRETHTAGGAANVALNLAALGLPTMLAGSIGQDQAGDRLISLLTCAGIDTRLCQPAPARPTIVKTRVIARNQQLCRIDHESASSAYRLDTLPALIEALAETDAVIVSDYAKGVISQDLLDSLISQARKLGKTIALDPKPSRRLAFRHVGLLTPNRHEALELAGLPEPDHGQPYPLDDVCARIHDHHAPDVLIVTLGADGMAISREGKVEDVLPTRAREVFDVSGAGDTVIATLAAALAAGASPRDAAAFANTAAGIVVSKMGTATPTPAEILSA